MRSLIIGETGGIGRAVATLLRAQGAQVLGLSRRTGLDLTDEASTRDALSRIDQPIDLILIATGILETDGHPPEKSWRQVDPAVMARQFAVNAIGPALVLKHALPLLPRDRGAHVGVLSARVGSIGDNRLGGWVSYRAAKAALNQIIHTYAIELARSHPQAVLAALHPGTVETDLTRRYAGHHPTVSPETAAQNLLQVLRGLGPEHSGGFYDWQGKVVPW